MTGGGCVWRSLAASLGHRWPICARRRRRPAASSRSSTSEARPRLTAPRRERCFRALAAIPRLSLTSRPTTTFRWSGALQGFGGVSLAVFHKSIDDFIVASVQPERLAFATRAGPPVVATVMMSRPRNAGRAKVAGLEAAFSRPLRSRPSGSGPASPGSTPRYGASPGVARSIEWRFAPILFNQPVCGAGPAASASVVDLAFAFRLRGRHAGRRRVQFRGRQRRLSGRRRFL